jgi:hypothetical protein
MAYSTEVHGGKMEGRARVYTAAIEHLPEYLGSGVGVGNFWGPWGKRSSFGGLGAHNGFIQVTIYWGLAGLLALAAVIWQAYRCLPANCGKDVIGLCLAGTAVSLFMMLLITHNLYIKEFSLGLGMLVGAQRWVWSTR